MKTLLFSIALFLFASAINLFASVSSLSDDKYIITYKFTEKDNPNSKEFKLYRDGNKLKLVKKEKSAGGKDVTTSTYVMLEEKICYEVISSGAIKTGGKHNGVECSYIGMKWGIYISDLDNWQKECNLFSSPLRTESVAGKDCTVHEVTYKDISVDLTLYWFYNNKLMLKKQNPSITLEAISIDENPTFAADEFTVPSDVQWF